MRRKSDRGKTKSTETTKEKSPEKSKKSHRHSRRRKKSSSSSEDAANFQEEVQNIPQPAEVEVKDIELPQEDKANTKEAVKPFEEQKEEWKEDNTFWESEGTVPTQEKADESSKEKEESSLWKVQSANGAGGGSEIQKLKICRQRPADSPETSDTSIRKRLSRGNKDGRSTDDSAHEESEKEHKRSKHKSRSLSRNSPSVVCDLSGNSPTKIKIINVSNMSAESKGAVAIKSEASSDEKRTQQMKPIDIVEDTQMSDTLDIALPADEPPMPKQIHKLENAESIKCTAAKIDSNCDSSNTGTSEQKQTANEDGKESSPKKSSPSLSPKNEVLNISASRSSSESDTSENESTPHQRKKCHGHSVLSTVQKKESTPNSPKQESTGSKDDQKVKEDEEEDRQESPAQGQEDIKNNTTEDENMKQDVILSVENKSEETNGVSACRLPRKRRWGSNRPSRFDKAPAITISTTSLKGLIPDAKPVAPEELQLSVEEEEGQLDDDDDEEDEVVAMVTKEEEKELERERLKEERQKEKEKADEDKRRRLERFEKSKPEPKSPEKTKVEPPRKIQLLKDESKKMKHTPSPPRRKPTSILYITHLVRPFTVQQLKNLLQRTGTIAENGFWIDKIKSKCYVQYTTEDAAVETRHALNGVRWPNSNPKTLFVDFASHDDMVMAQALSEEPEVPRKAEPLNMVEGWITEQARMKEKSRRTVIREWDVGKPEHPDEIIEEDLKIKELKDKKEQERRMRKERSRRSATPEIEPPSRKARRKEEEAPAKLLDDLFRKTKTSPCIYWLPLTQEQIAVKEEIRRQHMAEHERRMAELKKADAARRDRERRSRK